MDFGKGTKSRLVRNGNTSVYRMGELRRQKYSPYPNRRRSGLVIEHERGGFQSEPDSGFESESHPIPPGRANSSRDTQCSLKVNVFERRKEYTCADDLTVERGYEEGVRAK